MSYQRQFPGNHIKCIAFIDPTNPALSINMRGVPPKKNSEKGTLYHIPFTSYPVLEDGSSRRRVGIVIRPFFCFSFFFGAKNNGFKRLRFSGKQKAALNQSQPATCQQSRGLGIGDRGSGIGMGSVDGNGNGNGDGDLGYLVGQRQTPASRRKCQRDRGILKRAAASHILASPSPHPSPSHPSNLVKKKRAWKRQETPERVHIFGLCVRVISELRN